MKTESHEQFTERLEAIRAKNQILYRGYTIEPTEYGFEYYPTSEGRNDDADCVGDPAEYRYCGNVKFAGSLDDAKDAIWEKVMPAAQHKVVLNKRDYYFEWIEDAIRFAVQWNAEGFIPAVNA